MLDDFINLTQGQLLIKYWWLWLTIVAIAFYPLIKTLLKVGIKIFKNAWREYKGDK